MDSPIVPQNQGSDINALLKSCSRQDLIFLNRLLDLHKRAPDDFVVFGNLIKASAADVKAGHTGHTFGGDHVKAFVASLPEDTRAWVEEGIEHVRGKRTAAPQPAQAGADTDAWLWNAEGGQR